MMILNKINNYPYPQYDIKENYCPYSADGFTEVETAFYGQSILILYLVLEVLSWCSNTYLWQSIRHSAVTDKAELMKQLKS